MTSSHVSRLASEIRAQLRGAGVTAEWEYRDGDAATEILAAANASNADLIVVGTHGRTGLQRLVLGSVARNVLQHARCSVLSFGTARQGADAGSLRTIVRPSGSISASPRDVHRG